MPLYLVNAPTLTVLSLADAIAHLHAPDDGTDDAVIQACIDAAVGHVDGRDGVLNRAIADQTWDLKLDCFPYYRRNYQSQNYSSCCEIRIPLPPFLEAVSLKYIDKDGAEQTYDRANYHVSGVGGKGLITLRSTASWPTVATNWPEPITVQFRAGYIDGSDSPPSGAVPDAIIAAVKMIVGHLYANRETVVVGNSISAVELPQAAEWLLAPFRVYD